MSKQQRQPTFSFDGYELEYLDHDYNRASDNARSIEVPIMRHYMEGYKNVLEVGNVLRHYCPRGKWDVVDATERGAGVYNRDVMDWKPEKKYDLIVSISTLEHIGFGKYKNIVHCEWTPKQIVAKMMYLLSGNGVFVATIPLGYNPAWDKALEDGLPGVEIQFLHHVSRFNEWSVCSRRQAFSTKPIRKCWCGALGVIMKSKREFKRVLNLGCGIKPVTGATNHDLTKHHDYVDVTHDLNSIPWPFEDGAFDKIVAHSVFEHLDIDLLTAMNECWRILEPGGVIVLKLPHWNSETTWSDPTHRRGYATRVFDHFDPATQYGKEYDYYTDRKWKIIRKARMNPAKTSILVELEKRG